MLSSEIAATIEKVACMKSHFKGVYSIDNLPKFIKLRQGLIFNLSKMSEPGSHWITLVRVESDKIEIFDSLGTKFEKLKNYLKFKNKPEYVYNENPFQLSNSDTCGYFAITFLIERMFNLDLSYKELLAEIFEPNLESNEKIVIEFCNNL